MSQRSPARRRVTQRDVARAANVSTAIVSTVVNNKAGTIRVGESTRDRVWAAIERLGYVPNLVAQQLASGRNGIIGAFTYHPLFPTDDQDYYYEFLAGVESEAEAIGQHLLLFTGTRRTGGGRSMFEGGVNVLELADGAVLVGGRTNDEEIHRLATSAYPFVMIGHMGTMADEVSWVAADHTAGTELAVDHLYQAGHRRISMLIGNVTHLPAQERREGFAAACRRRRLGPKRAQLLSFGEPHPDYPGIPCLADESAVLDHLQRSETTALMIESSFVAHRIFQAAGARGIEIPGRLSLIGLGDQGDRGNVLAPDPRVAQILTPRRESGAAAVRLLMQLLESADPQPVHRWIPCALWPGSTLGAPPGKTVSEV